MTIRSVTMSEMWDWKLTKHGLLQEIWSGGQTGADLGGLIGARKSGIPTGGYMPKGFRTEDGRRPDMAKRYGMKESVSSDYPPRTRINVSLTEGTVVIGDHTSAGCELTLRICQEMIRPNLILPYRSKIHNHMIPHGAAEELEEFIRKHKLRTLNIAGNRESKNHGIQRYAAQTVILCAERLKKA